MTCLKPIPMCCLHQGPNPILSLLYSSVLADEESVLTTFEQDIIQLQDLWQELGVHAQPILTPLPSALSNHTAQAVVGVLPSLLLYGMDCITAGMAALVSDLSMGPLGGWRAPSGLCLAFRAKEA